MNEKRVENLIIVGGACAGYTAALYTARANLEPLVIEGFQWGGQLQNTTDVENYPGFPEGIMGPEMMQQFRAQAERFGTRFITDDATRIELSDGGIQRVWVGDDEHLAKAVILAMGAEPKRLGIPGEIELGGRGVSTCGVCDGAFFKGENVVVIGGGDSAMEDSIFISKFAERADDRPPPRRVPRLEDHARASARDRRTSSFKTPYVPEEFVAGDDGKIATVRLRNAETGEIEEIEVGGAFVAIGHTPRSELVARPGRHRRERLRADRGRLDPDQPRRRVRGRRPGRPHLPPGGHRRRHRLHGRARRRVVPARHAALAGGALGRQGRRRPGGRARDPRPRRSRPSPVAAAAAGGTVRTTGPRAKESPWPSSKSPRSSA